MEIDNIGIDMTSAFDTIDRGKLLENTTDLLGEDEWRMTRKLLTNTKLTVKLRNAKSTPFSTNIGSPQGDSLSPILFIIYLEFAMRELRAKTPRPAKDAKLPQEIGYADDQDKISRSKEFLEEDLRATAPTLASWSLKVNEAKTERTTYERKVFESKEPWRKVRKLGTLLGDKEEMNRRKGLASAAYKQAAALWTRSSYVSEQRRLLIYNACVKPILTYNMGTWALSKNDTDKLDAFHRTQLRNILNIRYPEHIHNKDLYARTKTRPISHEMFEDRWKLMGHILRMNDEVPAKKAMTYYFDDHQALGGFRGRPRTTIATKINQDLVDIAEASSHKRGRKQATIKELPKTLQSIHDLRQLERLSKNRKTWRSTIMDAHALLLKSSESGDTRKQK
jgi:hypothetical protein